MSQILEETYKDFIGYCKYWGIVDEDLNLPKKMDGDMVRSYNRILKDTLDLKILPHWKTHLIVKDLRWDKYFENRYHTSDAATIVWGHICKQDNFVNSLMYDPPSVIMDINDMHGEFIEQSHKAIDYIMKILPSQ